VLRSFFLIIGFGQAIVVSFLYKFWQILSDLSQISFNIPLALASRINCCAICNKQCVSLAPYSSIMSGVNGLSLQSCNYKKNEKYLYIVLGIKIKMLFIFFSIHFHLEDNRGIFVFFKSQAYLISVQDIGKIYPIILLEPSTSLLPS